ncbi:MAG: electron transporter RnfB, partial [Desulfobacterales bacterium]|nr:electron transporter RnfB [Desulfobacterales bacterium]
YCPDDLGDAIRAMEKCPRHRIVVVGKPSAKDLAALGDEALPDVVTPDFKTTVDDTEWRG